MKKHVMIGLLIGQCLGLYGSEYKLFQAIHNGNIEKVRKEIAENPDVDRRKNHYTPLYLAIKLRHVNIAKLLIDKGADIELKSKCFCRSPLEEAVDDIGDNTASLDVLIDKGVNINVANKDDDNKTVLHIAAKNPNPKILLRLLEAGALVNVQDKSGRTPLYNAMFYDRKENALILLKADADTAIADKQDRTPLTCAGDSHLNMLLQIPAHHAVGKSVV